MRAAGRADVGCVPRNAPMTGGQRHELVGANAYTDETWGGENGRW